MKKILAMLTGALLATVLMAGVADAGDAVILPDDQGECPAGFEIGYSPEFGEVCNASLVRDDGGAAATGATVTAAGTLPRTGSDSSLPLAQMGAVLVALGGLVVLAARKRTARTS